MKRRMRILTVLFALALVLCPAAAFADSEEAPEEPAIAPVAAEEPSTQEQAIEESLDAPKEDAVPSPDADKADGEEIADPESIPAPAPVEETPEISNETGGETTTAEPSAEPVSKSKAETETSMDKLVTRIAKWDHKSYLDIEDLKIPASDELLVSELMSDFDDAFAIETANGIIVGISVDFDSDDQDEDDNSASSASSVPPAEPSAPAGVELVVASEVNDNETIISESEPSEEPPISDERSTEPVGTFLATISLGLAGIVRILHALIM